MTIFIDKFAKVSNFIASSAQKNWQQVYIIRFDFIVTSSLYSFRFWFCHYILVQYDVKRLKYFSIGRIYIVVSGFATAVQVYSTFIRAIIDSNFKRNREFYLPEVLHVLVKSIFFLRKM